MDRKHLTFALCVSSEYAEKVEKTITEHADWMRETHSLKAGGGIHLVDY